jgi:hypothetical protein
MVTPGTASDAAPTADRQIVPSGEVSRTGCWPARAVAESRRPAEPTGTTVPASLLSPPTATQPAPPCTTVVSPGPVPCQDGGASTAIRAHWPLAGRNQMAGSPLA